jgi:hypothetical protein
MRKTFQQHQIGKSYISIEYLKILSSISSDGTKQHCVSVPSSAMLTTYKNTTYFQDTAILEKLVVTQ